MRKAVAVPLPDHVFRILKPNGREYWYHQPGRGTPAKGALTRLPGGPRDAEFWEAAAKLTGEAAKPGTVDALIAAYKASPKWARHRAKTQEAYAKALREASAAFGRHRVAAIRIKHVQQFLDDGFGDRQSMGNLTLSVLKALFAWGLPRGYGEHNPAREIMPFEIDEENVRPWSDAVYNYVLKHGPEPLRRAAVLGRATGQRVSDFVRMRGADRDGAGIILRIGKLREKEHWCPLSQEAIRAIDGWGSPPMTPYIFDGRAFSPARMQRMLRTWLAKPGTQVPADGVRLHGLRASAVCDDRIAGLTHQQIALRKDMSIRMVEQYSRHIDQRLAAGWEHGVKTGRKPIENRPR